ncbi:MAG TPA: HAD-IC family P-type ATPase [Acholeplasmataceae bacterium]|nr:HAD-IC family P-type ATPase [Acholeplasmataceae bacterium]
MAKKTNEKLNKELEKLEEEINGKETETPKTTTRGRKPKAVEPRVVEMPVEEEVKVEAPVTRKRVKVKEVKVVVEEEPLATPDDFSAPFEHKEEEKPKEKRKKDEVVVTRYNPDRDKGLTTDEVEARTLAGFYNKIKKGSTKSIPGIIFTNLFTFFNLLMFGIAAWLISAKAPVTNFFFLGTIAANILIGIIQEIKAKKIIDKLSVVSTPTAIVIRDAIEFEIKLQEVVIDDILVLKSGKQIPADAIMVSDEQVEVNEALLTGEADPVVKHKGDLLYSGSFVVAGTVKAQVVGVGSDVFIEKLTNQARKYQKPQSQLLKSLRILIKALAFLIIPIGAFLFYITTESPIGIGNTPYNTSVISTAGALIGMVPAGLFLLTSMALAVGVIRLADNNTLVQELYCIEMLARIDTLCLDKTGTITDGTMNVQSVIEIKSDSKLSVAEIIPSMMNAFKDENQTSKALIERFGRGKALKYSKTVPFSSARKYSAVEFNDYGVYLLGAPEYVLKDKYDTVANQVERLSSEGLRVIAVGYSKGRIRNTDDITGVVWPVALIVIEDSIRIDARETIEYFKQSGVDIKVISGDNPITVSRIAERAGIDNYHKYISLEGASEKEVIRAAEEFTIFGRVSPIQKKILIQTMKANGRTVAMTGDGVNDILALKEADTSIAMASGSDAARNVSHLVLLDSNFSSMPKVVSEGRRVINNVQKVATLFLTKTIFSIMLSFITIYLGVTTSNATYPISPAQLIPIDWFVIGIPSFLLALEYNNNKIKSGNFLFNIIKSALPGALAVIITSVLIYWLKTPLEITDDRVISTLIVITATTISLIVLYRVSSPLNVPRRILFFSMFAAFILSILFIPEFFGIAPIWKFGYHIEPTLKLNEILFLIVLIQAAYPIIFIVSNIGGWIKKGVNTVVNFFKNYV